MRNVSLRTQKELCGTIGIPQNTLKAVLKKSTRLLKTTKGKGRHAKTGGPQLASLSNMRGT